MKLFFFDCGTRDLTASLGLLLLRCGTAALMIFGHGWPKLLRFAEKKDHFPVPDFFPMNLISNSTSLGYAIFTELVCSLFLFVGFTSRLSAFLLGFTMVVAVFHFHAHDAWFMGSGVTSKEPALLYLVPCLTLILSGPGRFSLDGLLLPEKRRRRW